MAAWLPNLCHGFNASLDTFSPKWSLYVKCKNLWELSNNDVKNDGHLNFYNALDTSIVI